MLKQIAGGNPLDHVLPHPLLQRDLDLGGALTPLGKITLLSDQIVMMLIAAVLLVVFLPILVRKRRDASEVGRLIPTGAANAIELICHMLREHVARPPLGPHTDRFVKYIWTAFFFVLTMNVLGLVPVGSVTPVVLGLHIGGTPTANIYVTATLALLTLIMMVWNGLRLGGKAYVAHFSPGPTWTAPFMVPIEIIGTLARIFALALRLFVAMMAGHILLAVLVNLILQAGQALGAGGGILVGALVVGGSTAIYMIEIFVAFLQAFIFSYLTALFIGMSVNVHHEGDHGHEAPAH
ncbi:MAG: F0F1 ATP synthase subunit A [Thermoanaerobaculia bacterium]|nr:F0F1 ATP synthase subunit A [Thermoanaerobaculia bacterium]